MVENTDRVQEKNCEAAGTSGHVAAEAQACKLDPKYATPDTTDGVIAEVTFYNSENETQIAENAGIIRNELNGYFFSGDVDKLTNVLSGMTVEGRQQLIAKYSEGGSQFWDDVKENFDEGTPEYAAIEALMNEKATGDSGRARVALATLSEDPEKGLNMLRAILSGRRVDQIKALDQDFQAAFGTTLTDAIHNLDESIASPQHKAIFDILMQGSENIGAVQIKQMAELAVEAKDSNLLVNILAGDQQRDIDARAAMLADPKFMDAVKANFDPVIDERVLDALNKGKVALDDILEKDITGFYSNIENSIYTFEQAPEQDRQAFRIGREIVESGREPVTAAEQEAVRKFEALNEVLKRVNPAERAMLEDGLLHGEKTLISDIASSFRDGYFSDDFDSHTALAAVENMSGHEYALLSNPEYKKEFDRALATMITDETLRKSIMDMIDAKLSVDKKTVDSNPPGYTDSQSVRRPLEQFMSDLAEFSPAEADKQIAMRLSSLSTEEAERYNSSSEFKAQVDKFVARYVRDPISEALVNVSLASAGQEKSDTLVKLENFLRGQLQPAPNNLDFKGQASRELSDIAQVEELLKDPELLARMRLVDEQIRQRQNGQLVGDINPQDELLYHIFDAAIPSSHSAAMIGAEMPDTMGDYRMPGVDTSFQRMLQSGQADLNTKLLLSRALPGDWLAGRYEDVARLSESERVALRLTSEQQAIVDNAVANGGKLDLAGRFREYAVEGGDIASLMQEYSKLSEEQRADIDQKYRAQFGDTDFLADARVKLAESEISEEEKKVWRRVIDNKGELQLVDRMQLYILGTNDQAEYSDFRAELSKLSLKDRKDMKEAYSSYYGGNLDEQFLAKIPDRDIDRYRDYLSLSEVDGAQAFFDRMNRFEPLRTFDGTTLAQERMLQVNENLLRQFNDAMAKLPQEAQEAMAEYYSKAYQNNLDSNEEYAHFVADMTVTALGVGAAILATPVTGGASMAAMVAGFATVGGATRVAIIQDIQGGTFDASPENVLKLGFVGAVEGALSVPIFVGGKAVIGLSAAEREVVETTVAAAVKSDGVVAGHVVKETGEAIVANVDEVVEHVPVLQVADEVVEHAPVVQLADEVVEQAPVVQLADEVVEQAPVVQLADEVVEQAPVVQVADEVVEQAPVVQVADEVVEQAPVVQAADEVVEQAPVVQAADEVVEQAPVVQAADEVVEQAPVVQVADEVVERAPVSKVADDIVEEAPVLRAVDDAPVVRDVDDAATVAARTKAMQESVESGTFSRQSLEKLADNGDPIAVSVLAAIRAKEAAAARILAASQAAFVAPLAGKIADDLIANAAPAVEEIAPVVASPLPSEALIAMATVRRGEGPWQSAERILAADGKRHSVDEVRALTKAFQTVFAAENGGNGDMSGLKVKHNFITQDNYDDLIAACNNDTVKAVLLGLAQGAPAA